MTNHYQGQERRKDAPSITKEDVKEVIQEALELHINSDHHQFVSAMIAKEKRQQELWEKVKAHVFGWGAVALIAYLGGMLWGDIISGFRTFLASIRA